MLEPAQGDTLIRLCLASPADILGWSHGEITTDLLIDPDTKHPHAAGLFSEAIFGPLLVGRHLRLRRMGHIELVGPSRNGLWDDVCACLLGLPYRTWRGVVRCRLWIILEGGTTGLTTGHVLTEEAYQAARTQHGDRFQAETGTPAVKVLLERLDLARLESQLRQELAEAPSGGPDFEKRRQQEGRLRLVSRLRHSGNRPEWMILEAVPVLPAGLRVPAPLAWRAVQALPLLAGKRPRRPAGGLLTEVYQKILRRNRRLIRLRELKAPEVVLRNEQRMLEDTVHTFFSGDALGRFLTRGFRQWPDHGKRVDYSARAVVVPDPMLRLEQCGLPAAEIAWVLYQPFLLRRLQEPGFSLTEAETLVRIRDEDAWDALVELGPDHPILLGWQRVRQRHQFLALEPRPVAGKAIRVHPALAALVERPFDGHTVVAHLPLSVEARVEAATLMTPDQHVHSPTTGEPLLVPTADVILGCYYLTTTFATLPGGSFSAPSVLPPSTRGVGMIFHSSDEVLLAHASGRAGVHAPIQVRLPLDRRVPSTVRYGTRLQVEEVPSRPNGLIATTVGRVLFNEILKAPMPFYDLPLTGHELRRVLDDCYRLLGRQEAIALLERIYRFGFRELTRSGLSFAIEDLKTASRERVIKDTEDWIGKVLKLFERGIITESERFNRVIDLWTHARDEITRQMMGNLEHDTRDGVPYLNPVYLMACSEARGGVSQLRQLAGMYGLLAKPSGQIIEMPIKGNFRVGLSPLEYFCCARAARWDQVQTVRRREQESLLLQNLSHAAGEVVVTVHDCGTTQGVTKGALYKGEYRERPFSDTIRGRVSRDTITTITGDNIVHENEMISGDLARKIENLGIDRIRVRSPMTCQVRRGVCRLCYGMDLSTGDLVEEGTAVGIIAAQCIGAATTQLLAGVRTFLIGSPRLEEGIHKARKSGFIKLERIAAVINDRGERVALARHGRLAILGLKDRILEEFSVPQGAILLVEEGQQVRPGQVLCTWNPHRISILAASAGRIRFEEIIEGDTLLKERDPSGAEHWIIREHRGELHPQIVIEDDHGHNLEVYYLPETAELEVREGHQVEAGQVLARVLREPCGTRDMVGGLVTALDFLEARRPARVAVLAEVAGRVHVEDRPWPDPPIVLIQPLDDHGNPVGEARRHLVPSSSNLRVGSGEYIAHGDLLTNGFLDPHEVLRVRGPEAAQHHLLQELQSCYHLCRSNIDDRHFEIVLARMLGWVRVEAAGDTTLEPGTILDRQVFPGANYQLDGLVKVRDPGDGPFAAYMLVPREMFEETRARLQHENRQPPTGDSPQPATYTPQLLGVSKVAELSASLSVLVAARMDSRALTNMALAGFVYQPGLEDSVIMGRLPPAGTGFFAGRVAKPS